MEINQELYSELCLLRQRIKIHEKELQGRAPLVCTDSSLYEMAELCPKKLDDFLSITGIGKTFIDNYGQQFLDVILKHTEVTTEKKIDLTRSTAEILKELEKKLVSINRKNRLLFMLKPTNKYAFDMFQFGNQELDKLLFENKSITIADIENTADFKKEMQQFKRVSQLLREVNKDLRDKGQNDLYIGYPYVIGRIPGENFDVRAPLALFPVVAEKNATSITLSVDTSRDVIYNNTFVLAYFKFNNINKPLPSEIVEIGDKENFYKETLDFYSENEIHIKGEQTEIQKFTEYTANEFPHYESGELYIENCAVIGKFPICSNSIQKDFDEILQKKEINPLINDLLLNSEDIDYYQDGYNEHEKADDDVPLTVSEKNLVYINDINSSQEAVLLAIKLYNELVVQGPPGTGKSQVITNVISESVSEGKTVLMVSEKKTALDVVYSRLGILSQYALLIDDVGNKDAFYQQLSKMVSICQQPESDVDLSTVSDDIDCQIERLELIADKLYTPNHLEIEPYKLYINNRKYNPTDNEDEKWLNVIRRSRSDDLLALKYAELEKIHDFFKNTELCAKLNEYVAIVENYPWINTLRTTLGEYDVVVLTRKLESLKNDICEWNSKNVILRLLSKHKLMVQIKDLCREYFDFKHKYIDSLFLYEIDKIINGVNKYTKYHELKPLYDRLGKAECDYIKAVIETKKVIGSDFKTTNDELFNELIFEHIEKFESNNRVLFQDIVNFDSIIREVSELIAKKQELSRKSIAMLLSEKMHNITVSKRHGEILRALESKRKWSVNKFIKKFGFELFKSVKIWLLTPEVVSEIIPLETGIFDLVIFDEASQMYVEKGIPSILRAKKVVIAGDHKQLRPSNLGAGRLEIDIDDLPEDAEISAALEEESLLDLARFKYRDILLNFHYRSKYEELIAFSNYAFYNGRLYVSPNATTSDKPPIEVHKLEDATWVNRANIKEARYVVDMLKAFFSERKEGETVGIITFNGYQRDLIDELIDEECAKDAEFAAAVRTELNRKHNGEDIGLFVKNIESVQGDERDVIIFSVGYAKNESGRLVRQFGWLSQKGGENRLNVAISRARKKIHIVTSFEPSELQVEDVKNDGPRILKKYLQYAFAVSAGDKKAAREILYSFGDSHTNGQNVSFDSEFEAQVYEALKNMGYEVDTQVGVGGYRIDLAIKKDDRYILGIECDGKLYHSSKSARERDYHRQKYLESRGWRIHRIWNTNWWKNPQQEIDKIVSIVESLCQ